MVTEQAPSQTEEPESPAADVAESPPVVEDDTPIVELPASDAGAPDADAGGAEPSGDGEAEAEKPAATETEPAAEPDAEAKPAPVTTEEPEPTEREKAIQSAMDTKVSDAQKAQQEAEVAKADAERKAEEAAIQSHEATAIIQARTELIRRKMSDPNDPKDVETATREATLEVGDAYERIQLERRVQTAEAKVTAAETGAATVTDQALALETSRRFGIEDPEMRGVVLMGKDPAQRDFLAQLAVDAKAHRAAQKETKLAEVPAGGPQNEFDGGGGSGTSAPMTDRQTVTAYAEGKVTNEAYNEAIKRLGWND